ncbi:NADH-quinone oxidoreductase subunit E [Streptomyces sp. 8K308]|uniref:NAD(P)H-dependent oxidoreductase subunit E n=1 Tax=Streptomyces sp. 8K308 TaxID=2530388 RepID=UPI0010506DCB|nr:NAD(P)H-dependent oxidoreductase subunit E [Streptomyces sp. 8K308]TDC26397.1 NADH-quinone oxidoreductase subunit E [Streptomyces sp. 8K308]
MELHFSGATATEQERDAVDAALATRDDDPEAPAHRRDLLLPALHAVHERIGWISPGALEHLCRRLEIPPASAYGVASFYSLFSLTPRPRRVLHVCTDLACKTAGGDALAAAAERELGPPGQPDGALQWLRSPCLGVCERAPAALVFEAGEVAAEQVLAPTGVPELLAAARTGPATSTHSTDLEPPVVESVPQAGQPGLRLLRRVGTVDPTSLDAYRASGGYTALRRAISLGPGGVIREVTDSGLTGRGGAAFPTGRKWDATARQPETPHYLVCNADESEPGTFKDRVLLEGDPFAIVEAMTIAGLAVGARRGYLYLRGEYPRALNRIRHAIVEARHRGYLGRDVMGQPGFHFDIEIRRGAGAYICGEETAIFNSIEGYRGEPRSKPPFPVEKGLFGKPTAVNNIETLANVPIILQEGGAAYARTGTERSTGSKLFCLSGGVRRPGVYEVPFGTTLGELLDLAGGVAEGRTLRAVLLGGAAGGFVRADELDLPLTLEDARAAGTTLGSGVVLALDDQVDLSGILLRVAAFFRDESCGQCVPCRIGTVRQEEALQRLVRRGDPADTALLREVGQVMRDSSICGLGQTAWNAIESALDRLGLLTSTEGAA